MLVTELGIEMLVKPLHSLKASDSMFVIEFGKEILINPVLKENALVPIVVTEKVNPTTVTVDGIVIEEEVFA